MGYFTNTYYDSNGNTKINANPSDAGDFNAVGNSGYVTRKLVLNAEKYNSRNYMNSWLCTADVGPDLMVYYNHEPQISGNTASVQVAQGLKTEDMGQIFTVKLIMQEDKWMIDDIVCDLTLKKDISKK